MKNNKKRERAIPGGIEIKESGTPRQYEINGQAATFVPLSIKRRHISKVLIPPVGSEATTFKASLDLPLIRTLGKAFYWQSLLDSGEVANASDLAKQLKLEPGWVSEVLRMTLLAPDIVQAVLEGRQPRNLNLQTMRGRISDIPLIWADQRRIFGFSLHHRFGK